MDLWEIVEYVGETLVFIGVVGEVFAEWREPHRNELGKASSIVLVIGLALSLAALIGTNEYFNGTIATLKYAAGLANERAEGAELADTQLRIDLENAKKETKAKELDLAAEQRKVAEAQKDLLEAQKGSDQFARLVAASVNPRHIDRKRFVELMNGYPKRSVEVWYEPDDDEARFFAQELATALGPGEGAGWDVSLKPFPPKDRSWDTQFEQFRVLRRAADLEGMAIGSKDRSLEPKTSLWTLQNAINLSAGGWGIAGLSQWAMQDFADSSLCDNCVRVAVGPHRPNIPLVLFSNALAKATANSKKQK
jgi:hypothetical protein